MIIIFTGNGKGKTTAALGQALRAVGDGKKVLMIQFIKGPWRSGEDCSHKKLLPDLKIVKTGKGFVGIGNDPFPLEVHMKAALDGLEYASEQVKTKAWNIVILDEIWNALSLGLLLPETISQFIEGSKSILDHIILTGRDCPAEFIEKADLVTEMTEIKHPFNLGIAGAKGLEY